jgi:hypothetical protein
MSGIRPTLAIGARIPAEHFSPVQPFLNPELLNEPDLAIGSPAVRESRLDTGPEILVHTGAATMRAKYSSLIQ